VSTTIARLFLAFLPVLFLLGSSAQQNSPFTRYGLGEIYSNPHIVGRSMGGLSAAYADGINNNVGQSINFGNPATYGNLFLVTFDLGLTIDSRTLNSQNPTGKFTSNYFIPSYLALGIPLNRKKNLGLAFGLKPVSSISYSIASYARVAGDSLQTIYEGSGGMNQFFIGLGKKWKSFQIGFNTGYNFGRREINTRKAFLNDTVPYYQSNSSTKTNFNGVFLSAGMQYEFSVGKKTNAVTKAVDEYFIRLGATGTLQQKLNATQDINRQTYIVTTQGDVKIDSVQETPDIKGTIQLPATVAGGVTLHKTTTVSGRIYEMWSLGAEYSATSWNKYRFYNQADQLSNSWEAKLGVQFCPDPTSGRGYWNNVLYRAGFMIGKDYLNPDGNGLKHYCASFGLGLPIRKWRAYDNQFTFLNTALQFGKRGSAVNNITENYVQFSFGMSLSDLWFNPRRYD